MSRARNLALVAMLSSGYGASQLLSLGFSIDQVAGAQRALETMAQSRRGVAFLDSLGGLGGAGGALGGLLSQGVSIFQGIEAGKLEKEKIKVQGQLGTAQANAQATIAQANAAAEVGKAQAASSNTALYVGAGAVVVLGLGTALYLARRRGR